MANGKPGLPKGRTNNPNGRPKKGTTFTDILEKSYSKQALIDALWNKAIQDGDMAALKYLADRWEGTPTQMQKIDMSAALGVDTAFDFVESEKDFAPGEDENTSES